MLLPPLPPLLPLPLLLPLPDASSSYSCPEEGEEGNDDNHDGGSSSPSKRRVHASRATALITMVASEADLHYIKRHLQTEAVFNRALKMRKESDSPEQVTIKCSGRSERLKSFVRWCYNGPPLVRPDMVRVIWE